jgi:hypothetical protein
MRASPVFQRMFANPMTEKASGKVEIEDTNPEEFGDFLKAISSKQELPNRKFNEHFRMLNQIHFSASNVFALLILADRYDCKLLRGLCEKHLMNCVEIPFIHRLKCANSYELNKLKVIFEVKLTKQVRSVFFYSTVFKKNICVSLVIDIICFRQITETSFRVESDFLIFF